MNTANLRPHLKTSTGEPVQPVRLTYKINKYENLLTTINNLKCLTLDVSGNYWNCYRKDETAEMRFLNELTEIDEDKNLSMTLICTLTLKDKQILYIDFLSFERAYLLLPLLYQWFSAEVIQLQFADLFNFWYLTSTKIKLPFNDLFKAVKSVNIMQKPFQSTDPVQLAKEIEHLSQVPLPKVEKYLIRLDGKDKLADAANMLAFTSALLLRQHTAEMHWQGKKNYTLYNAVKAANRAGVAVK